MKNNPRGCLSFPLQSHTQWTTFRMSWFSLQHPEGASLISGQSYALTKPPFQKIQHIPAPSSRYHTPFPMGCSMPCLAPPSSKLKAHLPAQSPCNLLWSNLTFGCPSCTGLCVPLASWTQRSSSFVFSIIFLYGKGRSHFLPSLPLLPHSPKFFQYSPRSYKTHRFCVCVCVLLLILAFAQRTKTTGLFPPDTPHFPQILFLIIQAVGISFNPKTKRD